MIKFNKVFCVSASCANQAKEHSPKLSNVIDFLYNTQRNDIILSNSTALNNMYNQNTLNLVTVSRLEHQKAHLRLLPIIKKLHDEGFKFVLNIVGDGVLKEQIKEYILSNSMNEYVIMHGVQLNPFPYMKYADLFVFPSYWESWGMVLTEAMLLKVPVFATRTCPAEEVVGNLGFICENNADDIYKQLKYVLQNPHLIQQKREGLKDFDYDNDSIIKKLLSFIDD